MSGSAPSADEPLELPQQVAAWAALGYHGLRSALFFGESLPLVWLQRPPRPDADSDGSERKAKKGRPTAAPDRAALEAALDRLRALFARDAELIARGVIPLAVLAPRDPLGHGRRFLRILDDARSVVSRRKRRESRDFGRRAQD
jgi:hypothetical protein